MGKKKEITEKVQKIAPSIIEEFQKVLVKFGLEGHKLTKFSISSATTEASEDSVLNCPPGYHVENKCFTVGTVTTCRDVCVKNT